MSIQAVSAANANYRVPVLPEKAPEKAPEAPKMEAKTWGGDYVYYVPFKLDAKTAETLEKAAVMEALDKKYATEDSRNKDEHR